MRILGVFGILVLLAACGGDDRYDAGYEDGYNDGQADVCSELASFAPAIKERLRNCRGV